MDRNKNQHRLNLIVSSANTHTHTPLNESFYKKESNLFKHQSLQALKNLQFQEARPYQYVGVKQLKAYYQRTRKLSRQHKRTTVSGLFLSHKLTTLSILSRAEPSNDLLTKNQILQSKKKEREHLRTHADSNGEKDFRYTTNQRNMKGSPRQNSSEKEGYNSIQRIKQKYRKYEDSWNQIEEKCQRYKGFPSLLKEVGNEREKQLSKERASLEFQKTKVNSRMWEQALRSPQDLSSLYAKKIEGQMKLNKKSFGVLGKSKLGKETEWISYKQNEGYRFKHIKEQI